MRKSCPGLGTSGADVGEEANSVMNQTKEERDGERERETEREREKERQRERERELPSHAQPEKSMPIVGNFSFISLIERGVTYRAHTTIKAHKIEKTEAKKIDTFDFGMSLICPSSASQVK